MNIKELKRKLTRTPELDSTFPIHQYVYIYIVHIFTFYFVVLNLHIWVPDVYSMGYKQKSVFIPFSSSLLGRLGVCPPNKLSQVIFSLAIRYRLHFFSNKVPWGQRRGLDQGSLQQRPNLWYEHECVRDKVQFMQRACIWCNYHYNVRHSQRTGVKKRCINLTKHVSVSFLNRKINGFSSWY